MMQRLLVLVVVGCLSLPHMVQAALFGDDEARKKIADLQEQVQAQNQETQAALAELKKSQQALEARSQGMLDLMAQIDRLNQEISRLRGELEVVNHNIENTQQRQRDLYADTDSRLRKLEEGGVPSAVQSGADGNHAPAGPNNNADNPEARDLEAARALAASGKFKEAFDAYGKFLQTYPRSALVPDALLGLGSAQFSLKNYKASISTQQKLISQHPESDKVPDAMFSIANSQIQLSDVDGAKKTLRELLDKFPDHELAPSAKRRLNVLDSIKSR
ncbi:YbgF trimerization domain-containing protein [Methylobacillus flagellatus]|uniref:Cell division coordinator CpoB n=1 Tax=Methylobacillus flagellatus (strain ATCC 51484 / DSM 6875 / VKM B-1610 / KT) TaxID=265072 RepID=Q1GYT3_METFK|nr:YbgF trimerization domain-containing protein [Methylobacillus flagellatus]ABE50604.1 Tetratricopeptide region [Methylobacillus flagellatus KT]